ncbi:MAG: DNA polymerase III subunit beta [Candidatus Omnitrophica bacterium]|nr:DNA polymerase III subunit beta [Candidatus Omnitrophota bacterium]
MKTLITKEILLKGIQTVYAVIPNKSTLPILSHILIDAKKDAITLVGTDLEIGISTTIPAEVQEEGAIAVPAKRFNDLIKELPNTTLHIQTKKNQQVSIECEKGIFKIVGLPREEFPRLPRVENQDVLEIDQSVLQGMLTKTSFAVSKDESRYILTGILFNSKGEKLRLVATDGRRLASTEKQARHTVKGDHQVIVPFKAISELHRLLGEGPTVKISIKENQIAFDMGSTQLISRLIDGKFPNYEQVIPKESPQKLAISRENLLLATRRISLWTTPDSPSIRFDLKPNNLVLSKQTPEVGEAHEEVQAKYSGSEFSIGFNPAYLVDVLKTLDDEQVEMELPGPDKPGVIRTKDHYLYIVLPMQLNS